MELHATDLARAAGDPEPAAGALPLRISPAAYVGLPFAARAAGAAGFECWDLCRKIYADVAGIDLPAYGEISAAELGAVAAAFAEGMASEIWVRSGRPRALDIVVMRAREKGLGNRNRHCGVMVDENRMLHLEVNTATVLVPISHGSVRFRIVGYFRHQKLI